MIVTDNLADFPPAALPASIARQSLDDFLLDHLGHPPSVRSSQPSAPSPGEPAKSGPRMTASEIAAYLSTHGTPLFGERLLAALDTAP